MTLDEIRIKIDAIDSQMKPLFIQRMECARCVAETKAETGGDVYVPEREKEIVENRASGIDAEICKEYITFLKHLMSICRKYEYGILPEMQEDVLAKALRTAGLDAMKEHDQVKIAFNCDSKDSDLNLFINMVKLNQVDILNMNLEIQGEKQMIKMMLKGSVRESNMRNLLCQLGKEAEDFQILALR